MKHKVAVEILEHLKEKAVTRQTLYRQRADNLIKEIATAGHWSGENVRLANEYAKLLAKQDEASTTIADLDFSLDCLRKAG